MRGLYYRRFYLKKSNGSARPIDDPIKPLKRLQHELAVSIPYLRKIWVQGFEKRKSIVSNAYLHVDAKWSVHMDIKSFFNTVSKKNVESILRNLNIPLYFSEVACKKGFLPQGSPCSPILANYAAIQMDHRIVGLCLQNDLVYTRYADDLVISGKRKFDLDRLVSVITHIVKASGFNINPAKTRVFLGSERIVTGILIRKGVMQCPDQKNYEIQQLSSQTYLSRKQKKRLTGLISFKRMIGSFSEEKG